MKITRLSIPQFTVSYNARYWVSLFLYYFRGLPDLVLFLLSRIFQKSTSQLKEVKNDTPHIFFITYNARIRECKLAYAARLAGFRVTLITHKYNFIDINENYFDEYHIIKNPWECLKLIRIKRPDVVHLFVGYTNARLLPVLLFSPLPVVYDPYDCVRGMFNRKFKLPWVEEWAEKVFFTKADQLCTRSLEPVYLKRKFKYQLPPSTYFPDYCWKRPKKRDIKKIREGNELHVIYAGGINPEDRYPKKVFGFSQYIDVGRALAKQKIHLHLYPASAFTEHQFKNHYSIYYEESKENPYFHIYEPVTHTKLMEEMSKYDVGLHIFGIDINHNDCFAFNRAKADYSSAAKLFDYLEMGLPVLVHDGFHQRGIIRHYGRTISVDNIYDVRKSLVECLKRQKPAKTKDFCLDVQAFRLRNMYLAL